MINGEGTEEKLSSAVASPFDLHHDRESDGGDELSQYSSCGGESEFDRYCSASSVMGTPSFISTSSFHDSEFGSLKSFKLGGQNTNLMSFSGTKKLSGSRDGGSECADEMVNGNGVDGDFDLDDDGWGNEGVNENDNVEYSANLGGFRETNERKALYRSVEREGSGNDCDEEAMLRYEHSDGEDSMFGCESDEEKNVSYYGKNVGFRGEESEKKENQMAISSGMDFGSRDLDDFILESKENTFSGTVQDEIQGEGLQYIQNGSGPLSFSAANSITSPSVALAEQQNNVRLASVSSNSAQAGGKLSEVDGDNIARHSNDVVKLDTRVKDVKTLLDSSNQASDIDELEEYLGHSSASNIFEMNKDLVNEDAPADKKLKKSQMKNQDTNMSDVMSMRENILLKDFDLEKTGVESDLISKFAANHPRLFPMKDEQDREVKTFEDKISSALPSLAATSASTSTKEENAFTFDQIEDHFLPVRRRDFELNDFCDEVVNDMEDILLDANESPGSGYTHGSRTFQSQFPRPSRDGGSSASTSGMDYTYDGNQQPLRIDRVEVVGSRQMEGDVSFSERLVGVKKYTVYKISVWSGENHWEVERRYRDFSTLYHRLKKLFADHDWTLPSPWSFVDKESRKLFGNASPDVVADRSALIQECLQSLIHPKFSYQSFNALICFLSPSEGPAFDTNAPQSPFYDKGAQMNTFSTMGKKISLVVQVHPHKSMKQMLDAQHYRCAGCHRNFDDGKTRVQEFVQALGWGKPRLCEYSNQLFCSSCHNNDTAVLPARVLHYWDFTRYPVSQFAKSYLDSIHDQPMLCVSAVNPFLFSKVPTLQHVANIRNRIRTMLPYVRCPFHGSIYKGLESRRYLLDSNDFFALRDLIDLSKGVFSALPVMVETVSRKIEEHITEQCLVCYDAGVPCGARQSCENSLSLIFPFQEGEVKKCKSCGLVFHKNCFKKLASCPCGARFKQEVKQRVSENLHIAHSNSNIQQGKEESNTGLLSGLFSKVVPQGSWILRRGEPRRLESTVDTDITMNSLQNTTL